MMARKDITVREWWNYQFIFANSIFIKQKESENTIDRVDIINVSLSYQEPNRILVLLRRENKIHFW